MLSDLSSLFRASLLKKKKNCVKDADDDTDSGDATASGFVPERCNWLPRSSRFSDLAIGGSCAVSHGGAPCGKEAAGSRRQAGWR
jgi:hypothetical protein